MTKYTLVKFSLGKASLFLTTFLIMCGSGLFNTLFSLYIKNNQGSSMVVGLLASFYFTGMLLGSLKISFFIRGLGYIKSFISVASLMTISVLSPIITNDMIIWSFCRLLQGFCVAGIFIIIESWILSIYSYKARGKALSYYMIVLYSSYAVGQLFFIHSDMDSNFLFCIAAILINVSIISLSVLDLTPPAMHEQVSNTSQKFVKSTQGLLDCIISGIFISTIIGMLPIYAQEISQSNKHIAFVMISVFVAGVLIQYPIGCLSDKFSKKKIQFFLNVSFTFFLAIFIYLQYNNNISISMLPIVSAIMGIFSFSIYPLSTNLICEDMKQNEIINGIELVMISYGVGSIVGPIYIAYCMWFFGTTGYFIGYIVLTILLVLNTMRTKM